MPRYRELVGIRGGGLVYEYTSSISHDERIARHAVFVTLVHTLQLARQNLIPNWAACRTVRVLLELLEKPHILLDQGYEDIFESLEDILYAKAGRAAGYIWLGRSRNDHVSAALRLYTLEKLESIVAQMIRARRVLVGRMAEASEVPAPLHTHQQPSQLADLSCILACWEEVLAAGTRALLAVAGLAARSPLGAGAGAGTMAPLDRDALASLAGLGEPIPSTVYAAGSRLDITIAALAAAAVLVEVSRIASDIISLSTAYTGVIELPDEHVATSSIMPHKRNPVTLEVARARGSRASGLAAALLAVQAGLPYGYNLDLQEANPLLYSILEDLENTLTVLADLFEGMRFNREKGVLMGSAYPAVSAEAAEELALKTGRPLREAYAEVAKAVREGRLDELLESLGYNSPWELAEARRVKCRASTSQLLARITGDEQAYKKIFETIRFRKAATVSEARKLASSC